MYMECRHVKINGLRCQSPALKGGQFCYYHAKLHNVGAEPDLKFGPLQLPPPEDAAAVQLSVARINDAIIHGRLDLRKASALFNGLRIASRLITSTVCLDPDDVVQSAQQSATGEELAPDSYICEDEEDCNDCSYNNQCDRVIRPGDPGYDEVDDGEEKEDDS
ncbi:MAG: hypothetical protein WA354_17230 [Terracidiphilus sp.]